MMTPTNDHKPVAGFQLGIVVLKTHHLLIPGNVQNALSFPFPVLYEVVDAPFAELMSGAASVDGLLQQAIERLQDAGVNLIAGSCGSFANWQSRVRHYARVPVYLSIMAQVPMALAGLPLDQKLGVVFANPDAFSQRVCDECQISTAERERMVIIGANELSEFNRFFECGTLEDSQRLELKLSAFLEDKQRLYPEIGAWLFQCSDLPPYAAAVERATGLMVFDMTVLIHHLHRLIVPRSYRNYHQSCP